MLLTRIARIPWGFELSPETTNKLQMFFIPGRIPSNTWFGPYAAKPSNATLLCGSSYIIVREMQVEKPTKNPDLMKSILHHVSPDHLPGVRRLTREELNLYERPLTWSLFYAK
ncbi:unnamed protein product [Cylicostephanus goldi]|uniref:Uncharacterized protein n=1 Tax=Cylicostephanus goldi TaxID=71465 RepID=A0A3P6RXL4_CYLGO|nr:unnamed protein product [Cylicostephanus goldi]